MKKNKKIPSYAIYNFPYFGRDKGFYGLFPLKSLIALITCCAGAIYINRLLNITGESAAAAAVTAVLSFITFYTLLTFVKKRYVYAFLIGAAGFIWLFFHEEIYDIAESFALYVLSLADGPIVNTGVALQWSFYKPVPMLIILDILFGLICAGSTVRRFYAAPIAVFIAAASVPSFLSLKASFDASLGITIAGMMAMWAVNSTASANTHLSTGGAYSVHAEDRMYRKQNAKLPLKKRFTADLQRYGRHLSDGFIMFTVTAVTFGIVSSVFPRDGSIKFEEIINKISESFQSIGDWGLGLFKGKPVAAFNGFFNSDGGGINISGGLSPEDHSRKGIKVAEITTENTDRIYLRGDIGYYLDGDEWTSIAKLDFENMKYDLGNPYLSSSTTLGDCLDKYVPEIQYYLAYNLINSQASELGMEHPMGLQKVKVNYLQDMKTVLFPGTPFTYNFRDNNNFRVLGDFVALSESGRINSMETGVLYPIDSPGNIIEGYGYAIERSNDMYEFHFGINNREENLPGSLGEYEALLDIYDNYVESFYTGISIDDRLTVEEFVEGIYPPIYANYAEFADYEDYNADYAVYFDYAFRNAYIADTANKIQERLLSGEFEYSLETDNFSGENSPLYTFLNETKSGHCAMYATAMCLSLRSLGIPARYVTGFSVGGDNYKSRTSDGHYVYEVTDSDLHAWVEVYYEGFGWLPYDPTPPSWRWVEGVDPSITSTTTPAATTPAASTTTNTFTEVTTVPSETTTAKSGESTITTGTSEEGASGEGGNSEALKIILIAAAAVLAVFAIIMAIAGAFKGLDRKQRNLLSFFKTGEADKAVKAMLEFTLKLLTMRGIERQNGETPEEFGIRADIRLGKKGIISGAIPMFEKSEYDKEPSFTGDEQAAVYGSVKKLLDDTLDGMNRSRKLIARIRLFGKAKNKF